MKSSSTILIRSKEWAKNNPERRKKYREDNKEKMKAQQKIYRENNKDKLSLSRKNYKINNRVKINSLQREYSKNNPEKIRAYTLVKKHNIPLKSNCEECGSTERLEHHHPDYSKPLITETLCKDCHAKLWGRTGGI